MSPRKLNTLSVNIDIEVWEVCERSQCTALIRVEAKTACRNNIQTRAEHAPVWGLYRVLCAYCLAPYLSARVWRTGVCVANIEDGT